MLLAGGYWPKLRLPKQCIYGHPPSWYGGLGFCHSPVPVDSGLVRSTGSVHFHDILAQQIHLPYDQCAAGEVIGALLLHSLLGCRPTVILATHLHGKDRGALGKPHLHVGTKVVGRIWAEGFPVW